MGIEIERKFLVLAAGSRPSEDMPWRHRQGTLLRQGYLNRDPQRTVRVRIAGDSACLTLKGASHGPVRSEFEYPIPLEDAAALLKMCDGPLIEKVRYTVEHGGLCWEVDEFRGENHGLVLAELELTAADEPFERPAWVGEEVTDDPRYFNSQLAVRPYATW
jgi:CYTH domain-containing protein